MKFSSKISGGCMARDRESLKILEKKMMFDTNS